ncbi:restriction endonuclease subunit S [Mediterraneibacter glycyrrhizinilyticus]|nr:restriction endonuclease subunit S [Mediterraneibacter glycyrrhizinilyticus]MBM6855299.1 restriction endonuclease subunit S [Mediterraneibacter glycyrrhizinilyticus]
MKKRLGDIATYVNGYAFKPSDRGTKGLPIIRIQDLTGNSYDLGYYSGNYPEKIEINDGDILISWSGSLGIYIWNRGKALLNQHIFKVVFDKGDVNKQYFVFAVQYKLQEMMDKTHGATMKHIVKKDFDNTLIPFPALETQRKIANILSKVNVIISARKKQIKMLDELIKARFIEMFGDPIINPMGWSVSELSTYIQFLTSGSRGWAKYFANTGEYFITIKNVKNCRITLEDVQHVVPPNNAEAKRTRVQEGDLLISITADLGRTGVVSKEIADYGGYINQHLTCIRLDQSAVRPLYVAYYMESDAGKRQFQAKNQSAVKAGLNFNSINSLRIMVPPVELQDAFIRFVAHVDKSKVAVQKALDKTQVLFDSLMQKYFG